MKFFSAFLALVLVTRTAHAEVDISADDHQFWESFARETVDSFFVPTASPIVQVPPTDVQEVPTASPSALEPPTDVQEVPTASPSALEPPTDMQEIPTASPSALVPPPVLAPVGPTAPVAPVAPTAPIVVPPVGPPTLAPSPRPVETTPSPTSAPTTSPTTSDTCTVEVIIACFTADSVPCEEIMIPSDNQDCNTRIQYSYQLTNLNSIDPIDIIGLMRVRNGVSADFTERAVGANPLGPGDIIVVREEIVLDVCLDDSIETTVVVVAEVPGGVPCMDEAANRFFTGTLAGGLPPSESGGVISPTVSPSPSISPSPTMTPAPTSVPTLSVAPFLPSFPPFSLTASPSSTGVDPLPTPGTGTSAPVVATTNFPTNFPTTSPSSSPTVSPTRIPTVSPTGTPTKIPTVSPTRIPTLSPTGIPTVLPTAIPTESPTRSPTGTPTKVPTVAPILVSESPSGGLPSPSETSVPTISDVDPLPTPISSSSSPSLPSDSSGSESPTFIGIDEIPTISPVPTITPDPAASVTEAPSISGVDPLPTRPLPETPTVSPVPTVSPGPTVSAFPTATASPSVVVEIPSDSPTAAFCNISTVVSCEDEDGESCNFVDPVGQQCIGDRASELRFIYQTDSFCDGNNTQSSFTCLDENRELPRPSTVYIKFYFGEDTFYEGVVNSGNIISVPVPGSRDAMVVEISNLNEDNTPNLPLQSMLLSIQCREEDALFLYDTFGALQLTGFRNTEQGLISIFTTVFIRYTATNIGTNGAILTGAFKTNPITGMVPLLPEGAIVPLDPGQSQSFSDIFLLNLGTLVGMPIEFSFLTSGTDVETGAECGTSDAFTLLVSP
ncbi:laminin G domain containing protein [Nitzschia inconspicua]|uniref:Laminin G domain containing protein n=1 Tax=Nitzschia inconspicua TaxID=303405 RepID=A0A9K3L579_9STRA|nr:laminin G domain containing protein [Nitzschia inconspicua]